MTLVPLFKRGPGRAVLAAAALCAFAVSSHAEPLRTCFLYSNPIGESGWTYQQELARKELQAVFPHIDWTDKQWATWAGDRAEPYDDSGHLPPGPFVQQRGRVMVAWPTKLTFAPALADRMMDKLRERKIMPEYKTEPPADTFAAADVGRYPWETALWRKLRD